MPDENLGDRFLVAQAQREQGNSDQWLRDLVQKPRVAPAAEVAQPTTPGASDLPPATSVGPTEGVTNVNGYGMPEGQGSWYDNVSKVFNFGKGVVKDVVKGVAVEGVPQFASGAIDTFNEIHKTALELRGWAFQHEPDLMKKYDPAVLAGRIKQNEDGQWVLTSTGKPVTAMNTREQGLEIPNWKDEGSATTMTGSISRFIGNYAVASKLISPALKALEIPPGVWSNFINDFVVGSTMMDPEKQTKLLKMLPDGPIKDFLVEPDPEKADRLWEHAVAGGTLGAAGVAFEGLKHVLGYVKRVAFGSGGGGEVPIPGEGGDHATGPKSWRGTMTPGHQVRAVVGAEGPSVTDAAKVEAVNQTLENVNGHEAVDMAARSPEVVRAVIREMQKRGMHNPVRLLDEQGNPVSIIHGAPPPEEGFVPAAQVGEDTYVGNPGEIHPDVMDRHDLPYSAEQGFVGPEGKFLTRQEAVKAGGEAEANQLYAGRDHMASKGDTGLDSAYTNFTAMNAEFQKEFGPIHIKDNQGLYTLKDYDGNSVGTVLYEGNPDETVTPVKFFFKDGTTREQKMEVVNRFKNTAEIPITSSTEDMMKQAGANIERDVLALGDKMGPDVEINPDAIRNYDDWQKVFENGQTTGLAKLNLETITGPDDFIRAVDQVAKYTREKGVESVADRQDIARQIDIPIEDLINGQNGWGKALDQYQIDALGWSLRSAGEQMIDLAKSAVDIPSAENRAKAIRAFTIYRNIQEFAEGASATTGRSLNAWKSFTQEAGPNAQAVKDMMKTIDGNTDLDDLVAKIADLDNAADAGQLTRAAATSTSRRQFLNIWYNILLSNPQTHARNMTGNALSILTHLVDRSVAARLSTDPEGVQVGEASAFAYGMLQSTKDAFMLAAKGLMKGDQTFGGPVAVGDGSTQMGGNAWRQQVWQSKGDAIDPSNPLLSTANLFNTVLPTKWLGAEDDFFKWILYRGELRAGAFRTGTQQGLAGDDLAAYIQSQMAVPSQALDAQAVQRALTGTFNQPLDPMMEQMVGVFDKMNLPLPHTDVEIPVGRVLMPFIRTPANIVKWSYDHSPFAAMFPSSRIESEWMAGGASRDLVKAKIITGSLAAGSVADLVLSGHIDGAGPSDPNLARTWRAAGHEPFTVKIGNNRYGYSGLSPVGDIIGNTATAIELMQYATDKQVEHIVSAVTFAWTNNFLNKSFFQGLNQFFHAVQDPTNYGDKFFRDLGASGIPTVSRNLRQIVDPETRMAFDVVDKIKDEIPGVSKTLPANVDHFGRDIPVPGATMNPFAKFVSPSPMYEDRSEPIDRWLWDHKVGVQATNRVQDFGKNGVQVPMELTPDQFRFFKKQAGNDLKDQNGLGAKDSLNALVTGQHPDKSLQSVFNRATPDAQVDIVKREMSKYKEDAKKVLLQQFPTTLGDPVQKAIQDKAQLKGASPVMGGGLK